MPDGEQGRRERRIRTVIVEDEAPARGLSRTLPLAS
jgi:hypothetical protein